MFARIDTLRQVLILQKYIDVTYKIDGDAPIYPGDVNFKISSHKDDVFKVSAVTLSCHIGTHIDAPSHLLKNTGDVSEIPLETLIGECTVLEFTPDKEKRPLSLSDIEHKLKTSPFKFRKRILLKLSDKYNGIDIDCAKALLKRGVILVGTDNSSIDAKHKNVSHDAFLSQNVPIIENIDLHSIDEGYYIIYALPLPIANAEASPCRVVLSLT